MACSFMGHHAEVQFHCKSSWNNGAALRQGYKCSPDKRPQAKCPPTCEMSVCGEYIYTMYIKKMPSEEMASSLPPLKAPPLIKRSMVHFKTHIINILSFFKFLISLAVLQAHGYLTLRPKQYNRLLKEIEYKIVTIYTM